MTRLYKKLLRKKIRFTHVCEVGVYYPETSNILDFIRQGIRATLVEADPESVEKIRNYFLNENVRIIPVAVWDDNGMISLSKARASTFVSLLPQSPARANDNYRVSDAETFTVAARKFSEIDDGSIDLLSADIEGAEWYVIKHLRSRPKIISVETHGKYYSNPYLPEILQWMKEHNYALWYKDNSDSVFVRKDVFLPQLRDKLETRLAEWKIKWKKLKKIFKKK